MRPITRSYCAETLGALESSEEQVCGGCWPDGRIWLGGLAEIPEAAAENPLAGTFTTSLAIQAKIESTNATELDGDMSSPSLVWTDQTGILDGLTGDEKNALAAVRYY